MIKVYVASAFSKDNAGGNKAGIVFDRPDLSAAEKMKISAQLGYSETAFVTSSELADYRLEYFTPTEEVPLCGHATIASFAAMKLLGRLSKHAYTIETKAGILSVEVSEDGLVMMQQNRPAYYDLLEEEQVSPSLGSAYQPEGREIQIISTGLRDIILPIPDSDQLHRLVPDFSEMAALSRDLDVVGIHAFALTPDDPDRDAVCRNFAPLYGIDEESATGTSSCALAAYLFKHGTVKNTYIFEQGYSLNLPSRIIVKITYSNTEITDIHVGGYGYLVEEKDL